MSACIAPILIIWKVVLSKSKKWIVTPTLKKLLLNALSHMAAFQELFLTFYSHTKNLLHPGTWERQPHQKWAVQKMQPLAFSQFSPLHLKYEMKSQPIPPRPLQYKTTVEQSLSLWNKCLSIRTKIFCQRIANSLWRVQSCWLYCKPSFLIITIILVIINHHCH